MALWYNVQSNNRMRKTTSIAKKATGIQNKKCRNIDVGFHFITQLTTITDHMRQG